MPRKTKDRKPAPRAANRNRLMVCDCCGWQVRATIGPYAQRRALYDFDPDMVARCVCGATLVFKDLEDAAAVGDREAEQHPAYHEDQARWVRRVLRQQRGGGPVGQCGGCRKPITRTNELCWKCGFQNDLRGRRNHGRYTEGTSGRVDPLPF